MKTLILALLLAAGCTNSVAPAVAPGLGQANGIAVDTTLCCPPGYRCQYRPDLGLNHYGSAWWCISTSGTYGGEPTRCN